MKFIPYTEYLWAKKRIPELKAEELRIANKLREATGNAPMEVRVSFPDNPEAQHIKEILDSNRALLEKYEEKVALYQQFNATLTPVKKAAQQWYCDQNDFPVFATDKCPSCGGDPYLGRSLESCFEKPITSCDRCRYSFVN